MLSSFPFSNSTNSYSRHAPPAGELGISNHRWQAGGCTAPVGVVLQHPRASLAARGQTKGVRRRETEHWPATSSAPQAQCMTNRTCNVVFIKSGISVSFQSTSQVVEAGHVAGSRGSRSRLGAYIHPLRTSVVQNHAKVIISNASSAERRRKADCHGGGTGWPDPAAGGKSPDLALNFPRSCFRARDAVVNSPMINLETRLQLLKYKDFGPRRHYSLYSHWV